MSESNQYDNNGRLQDWRYQEIYAHERPTYPPARSKEYYEQKAREWNPPDSWYIQLTPEQEAECAEIGRLEKLAEQEELERSRKFWRGEKDS